MINKFTKIKNFIPVYFKAMRNKETPKLAKILGLGAILYAVMPADFVNDMIPFLGILDDAIVLPFLIYVTSKMIPDYVMEKEKIEYVEENK
ncbi:MAG: YkvA family protein [Anaerococcus obesiensis]